MLTAEAQIRTNRPSRYLIQLCSHASDIGQHRGHGLRARHAGSAPEGSPELRHAEWSDTQGVVRLSWGQCTLQATPGTLTLRAEAADEENLRRIQDLIGRRLESFGRRDHLKVDWQQQRNDAGHAPDVPTSPPGRGADVG
jgi:hypothetical protein